MKKFLLFLSLSIAHTVLAEPITDIRPLLLEASRSFLEEETDHGYPVELMARMSPDDKAEISTLIQTYDANLTEDQKQQKALIEQVEEKCSDNVDAALVGILNPNSAFHTSDRVIITLFEKGNQKIPRKSYERAIARQKLAKIVSENQGEIYAYATLFCPRHALKLRSNLNMSPDFSYKDFYNSLPDAEKQELDRVVYISLKHLKRFVSLGLPTQSIAWILSDVPQLMYRDFKRENPLAAQIDSYCQDGCHVHDIQVKKNQTWPQYAKEYALTHMKSADKKCKHSDCFCNSPQGTFYAHKEPFVEIANDIEKMKGKNVIFSPNGERDEIDITDGIAYSLSNGRIVVFPDENDDDASITATTFFAQEVAKNLAKECTKDQFYGVLPKKEAGTVYRTVFKMGETSDGEYKNMKEEGCYPRELEKNPQEK